MKILVLGAGGMAGHVITLKLMEFEHKITGFSQKKLHFCETIIGDIMTVNLLETVRDYDAVINCIGILNNAVDVERHKGIWINSFLPHMLANHAKRVIHLSTDCVFSGHEGGNYSEESFRSADSLYGRSKALGELNDARNLTIRTSIVGPDINENGIGLFNWFMKQSGTVNGYSTAIWSGVTTIVLAEAIQAALEQNITGLYHLTNSSKINKFELLKLFNTLRRDIVKIIPSNAIKEDKSLVCTRTDFDFFVPSYSKMISEMYNWIRLHNDLYQQYKLIKN